MKKLWHAFLLFFALLAMAAVFSACGGTGAGGASGDGSGGTVGQAISDIKNKITGGGGTIKEDETLPDRDPTPQVLEDTATGVAVFGDQGAAVDYSNINDGYIMVKYEGDNPKVKLQITKDGADTYTYDVATNAGWVAFPIQESGGYTIAVFLNISGDQYSQAAAASVSAQLTDEFAPFLRPNQYCYFTSDSEAVATGAELAAGAKSDLKVIENVFIYVTDNVAYDYDKASTVQSGYLPNVDDTLSSGAGICFDYASLTTAMLRSQRIPCRLVVGYAGQAYHAWISVHVEGIGWVDNMIEFHGDTWTRMDPTFAASGDRADPNVIGDGTNYNPKYYY
ncbi:MAG: transglutaminase-like domain-containing protein [Clostridiales Family XIII bacterium]|jgi:hypothetical protein|nr:transglutaminase-like domain-containing protein [Clostridiales Family XIII bacterium]